MIYLFAKLFLPKSLSIYFRQTLLLLNFPVIKYIAIVIVNLEVFSDRVIDLIVGRIPYSGLFSLGVNFPEFHKWVHYSGKFILGCYMKFDCGLPLQKLAWTQLYVQMTYKNLS